jgi:pimeloyl-ACP methyl ester carboxylesterase
VIAALVAFHLGGGWYFAGLINDRAISAAAKREELTPKYSIEVLSVEADRVTLRKSGDERLGLSSTYGLFWEDGWGIITDIVSQLDDGSVVRAFQFRGGEPLETGQLALLDTRVYPEDPFTSLGIAFEDVFYTGELGEYPAWFVAGERTTWFIFVHGNAMTRLDGLRTLPTIVDLHMPALIITYRNDDRAPADPGGHLTYGKHEWRDLEAAVQYALDNGAESVVLGGMSMGGAIVMAFLTQSTLSDVVSGVVLDAPVMSFQRAVEFEASAQGLPLVGWPLPGTLVWTAERLASMRYGVDWAFTDYLDKVDELSAPILIIHGTLDSDVPIDTSEELAELRPDLVRDFYVADGAGHAAAWNLDPAEYDRRLASFLLSLSRE